MCGIFGYLGDGPPAPALLTAAAAAAGRRGPHGWGWVWRGAGELQTAHYVEPLDRHLERLTVAPDCRAVLGHARLATIGDWRRPDQLQPIVVDGHAVAHNGVIRNAEAFAAGCATDSIALARAYAAARRSRAGAGRPAAATLATLLAAAEHVAWAIAVLDAGGPLLVHRRYHPVWLLRQAGAVYLSSQRFHAMAHLAPEDRLMTWGVQQKRPGVTPGPSPPVVRRGRAR